MTIDWPATGLGWLLLALLSMLCMAQVSGCPWQMLFASPVYYLWGAGWPLGLTANMQGDAYQFKLRGGPSQRPRDIIVFDKPQPRGHKPSREEIDGTLEMGGGRVWGLSGPATLAVSSHSSGLDLRLFKANLFCLRVHHKGYRWVSFPKCEIYLYMASHGLSFKKKKERKKGINLINLFQLCFLTDSIIFNMAPV